MEQYIHYTFQSVTVFLRASDRNVDQRKIFATTKIDATAVYYFQNIMYWCIFTQEFTTINVWHNNYNMSSIRLLYISCVVIKAQYEPKCKKYGSWIDWYTQSVLWTLCILFSRHCITFYAAKNRSNHTKPRRCW